MIFAIQRTVFRVIDSKLIENIAEDGGVLYGMGNRFSAGQEPSLKILNLLNENKSFQPSLGFVNTLIEKNWAAQNLI